jgi:hypothetical protein
LIQSAFNFFGVPQKANVNELKHIVLPTFTTDKPLCGDF